MTAPDLNAQLANLPAVDRLLQQDRAMALTDAYGRLRFAGMLLRTGEKQEQQGCNAKAFV